MTERLPPQLADALRPGLPGLAEEIIAAIGREVPEYRRPLEGPFGRGLRAGVERALGRFVEALVDPAAVDDASTREIYVELGRGEVRSGRSLDALLSAYRLGARIAWERCVEAGRAAGFAPEGLYELASRIFPYIDRISAESVEGYAAEQSATLAERQRGRRALVRCWRARTQGPRRSATSRSSRSGRGRRRSPASWCAPRTATGLRRGWA